MPWRKVHLGDETWEWRMGGGVSHYVVIRSPSGTVTRVPSEELGGEVAPAKELDDDYREVMVHVVTPGLVKSYIEHNTIDLTTTPRRRKGR